MSIIAMFVPLVALVVLPSVLLKLASLITRTKVLWKHCLLFGAGVAVLSIVGRAITGSQLPVWLGAVVGACIYLSVGSWFIGPRGLDREGRAVGFVGGVKVMIVFLILVGVLVGAAVALSTVLLSATQR